MNKFISEFYCSHNYYCLTEAIFDHLLFIIMFYYFYLQGRRGPEGEDGRQVNIEMNFYNSCSSFSWFHHYF